MPWPVSIQSRAAAACHHRRSPSSSRPQVLNLSLSLSLALLRGEVKVRLRPAAAEPGLFGTLRALPNGRPMEWNRCRRAAWWSRSFIGRQRPFGLSPVSPFAPPSPSFQRWSRSPPVEASSPPTSLFSARRNPWPPPRRRVDCMALAEGRRERTERLGESPPPPPQLPSFRPARELLLPEKGPAPRFVATTYSLFQSFTP